MMQGAFEGSAMSGRKNPLSVGVLAVGIAG